MPLLANSKHGSSKSLQGIPAQQEIANKVYQDIYKNAVEMNKLEKAKKRSEKRHINPKMKPRMKLVKKY